MSWGRCYGTLEMRKISSTADNMRAMGPKTLAIEILKVTDQDGNFVGDASILSK